MVTSPRKHQRIILQGDLDSEHLYISLDRHDRATVSFWSHEYGAVNSQDVRLRERFLFSVALEDLQLALELVMEEFNHNA